MSRYILIRRLRGPAFLLLVGVLALLAQAHILSWGRSWPLYLILAGVFLLAERAALAGESGNPSAPFPGGVNPNAPTSAPAYPMPTGSAIVPAHSQEFEKDHEGEQS